MTQLDDRMMSRALALAHAARFHASPNPAVGCVIARDDQVVAEAATGPVGSLHAEARALLMAGGDARRATAYVTLEPCDHQGRTPPCSLALIEAGVARVVIGTADPHAVAGGGADRLRAAGIAVDLGCAEAQAQWHHRGFLSRIQRRRPWVRLKMAASMDGRTAMASGESQWITGADARADVQLLRAESDCVLTGIGTLLADDPAMTVRLNAAALGSECDRQPLRGLVDTQLRCPAEARWLSLAGDKVIFTAQTTPAEWHGAVCQHVPVDAHGLSLGAIFSDLAAREVNSVLVEAGPTLAGQVLQRGWVDEFVLYLAPALLGDAARPLARLPGLDALDDAPRFKLRDVCQLSDDLRVVLIPDPNNYDPNN